MATLGFHTSLDATQKISFIIKAKDRKTPNSILSHSTIFPLQM